MELMPYQVEGSEWMAPKTFALLADEMGLGKTAQAIRAADIANASRVLVICPASLCDNWREEYERFSVLGLDVAVMYGKEDVGVIAGDGLKIASFSGITDHTAHFLKGEWCAVIVDEAHYLKTRTSKRTKAARKIFEKAKKVWWLTGTPRPNNTSELFVPMVLAGEWKDNHTRFVEDFCTGYKSNFGFVITGTKDSALPRLKEMLSRFMLRRLKVDVLKELPNLYVAELPVLKGKVDEELAFPEAWISGDGTNRVLHRKLEEEYKMLSGTLPMANSPQEWVKALGTLQMSTSTLRKYLGLQKVKGVIKWVNAELDKGVVKKIVIFAVHRSVIELLINAFKGRGCVNIYGATPAKQRQLRVKKFQEKPKCQVFIGQITAAGVGITLTAAHSVVFVEQSFVPAENAQAAMRVHRIGQTHSVTVRFATIAGDGLEQRIQRALRVKTHDAMKVGF